ncbi:MAG: class B sortase [Eubacteriales bacterium]|nr:class B sortase [Eubacteriales bacterium]
MTEKYTKKKKSSVLYRIITVILLIIIAVSGFQIGKILYGYHKGTSEYKKTAETAHKDGIDHGVDWDALLKMNPDIKAWLYQEDSVIDFAIVQSTDNEHYLYRLIDGTWNSMGTPFVDYRCKDPFHEFLTIVYGHRMKNHTVFWYLADYRNDPEYYKKHPTLDLYMPEGNYKLKVFAATTVSSDSSRYQFDFSTDEQKQEYLDWIRQSSTLKTNVKVSINDRIVMFSTCSREDDKKYGDARALVFAKMVKVK